MQVLQDAEKLLYARPLGRVGVELGKVSAQNAVFYLEIKVCALERAEDLIAVAQRVAAFAVKIGKTDKDTSVGAVGLGGKVKIDKLHRVASHRFAHHRGKEQRCRLAGEGLQQRGHLGIDGGGVVAQLQCPYLLRRQADVLARLFLEPVVNPQCAVIVGGVLLVDIAAGVGLGKLHRRVGMRGVDRVECAPHLHDIVVPVLSDAHCGQKLAHVVVVAVVTPRITDDAVRFVGLGRVKVKGDDAYLLDIAGDGLVVGFEGPGIVEHHNGAADALAHESLVSAGKHVVALALTCDAVPVGAAVLARLCRCRKQRHRQHGGEDKRRQKPEFI